VHHPEHRARRQIWLGRRRHIRVPGRAASASNSAGSSADRSRERGHQAPVPYPASLVVGAVGFIQKRSDCSAAVAFEGLVRARGPDDTSVPPSPV